MKEGWEQKGKAAYDGTFPTKTSERGDTEVLGEKKVVVITTADHSSGTYPNNNVRSNMEELTGGGARRIARHKKQSTIIKETRNGCVSRHQLSCIFKICKYGACRIGQQISKIALH